jgi:hypothetical protein
LKKPFSLAAAQRCCDDSASASQSWRLMPYFVARFSAVIAMGAFT